jgi:hypothetical protein
MGYDVQMAERYAIESEKPGALEDLRVKLAERYADPEDPKFGGPPGGELYAEFEHELEAPPLWDPERANRWTQVRELVKGVYDVSDERRGDFKVVPPTLLR